ncbi:aldolase catalytic domain-containing protein [uncultured Subdoligranulum sp.]|uniref:aldolase catalytic domain-containing protein n=1 Tax=uncultured Subdoligranulum sp. TaxID=512298 RepID=UPI00261C8585|nr:aldolase catalytic domain-containing protein [uncultured Subdoligranulum sp.]
MNTRKRSLLDCTLRDGGYVNDWEFGKDYIPYIFERIASSGVDAIEVGFLDERRPFDPNRTIMPDTESVNRIFGNLDSCGAMKVAMIDYGTCGIEHIQPCSECWLDGIRVIFKKENMHAAIDFCKQIKDLGYQVFVQAVSITSYSDDELRQLIELANGIHPHALSMVDTYGLLDAESLGHIISVIDDNLLPDITLGYHAHNNFQLGYANAMSMLNKPLSRDVLVDGTLYGMGKSAGNAPIELIAMYMNTQFGAKYDVLQMQEAISTSILDIYKKTPWGYTLFYYIAAANKCHPNYVSFLMNKRTLSITAVNEILQKIPDDQKLGKNMSLIEQLYIEYQETECNDEVTLEALKNAFEGKSILMLGPGTTAKTQEQEICDYIAQNRPISVAVNYIPDKIPVDHLFLTNSRRYLQMAHKLTEETYQNLPIIATSNVTRSGGKFPFVVNYSSLIDKNAEIVDNSMVMLLKLLMKIGVKECALAGFDGYTPDTLNYLDVNMEYSYIKEKADILNQYAKDFFRDNKNKIHVQFITESYYQK